jgi:Aldo/keto reductase family
MAAQHVVGLPKGNHPAGQEPGRRGGVTLFDTAQGYGFGASQPVLAPAGYPRDHIVIATHRGLRPEGGGVAPDASPDWIRQGVDDSPRALDTHYIDHPQPHWPDPKTPFKDTAGALTDLVSEGKIQFSDTAMAMAPVEPEIDAPAMCRLPSPRGCSCWGRVASKWRHADRTVPSPLMMKPLSSWASSLTVSRRSGSRIERRLGGCPDRDRERDSGFAVEPRFRRRL